MSTIFRKLTKREKVLLYILLVILILYGIGMFVVKPLFDRHSELENTLFELELKEFEVRSGINNYERYKEEIVELETEVDELLSRMNPVLSNQQIDAFVSEIAIRNNIVLKSFNVTGPFTKEILPYMQSDKKEEAVNVQAMRISIRLEGSMEDFENILDLFSETGTIRIETCNILSGEGGSLGEDVSNVGIVMTFEIYMHEEGKFNLFELLM
ncbi:MAG TPA: hypothetical protein GXZ66_11935 [Clostridiaceae bacterium]|jgi:Tfp pilus assembly protein PilO|nr:hypothetical protein [Clostridiaceae bacterium]HOA32216.1 hypothetical protein [Clostridia bacterium]